MRSLVATSGELSSTVCSTRSTRPSLGRRILPADATKKPEHSPYWSSNPELAKQHTVIRNRLKAVALGVLYGKTAYTIADEEGMTVDEAKALLKTHRRLFKRFWLWITGVTSEALATRRISTRFGWTQQLLSRKEREAHLNEEGRVKNITNSLQNFPMQAHGAEMLRLPAATSLRHSRTSARLC